MPTILCLTAFLLPDIPVARESAVTDCPYSLGAYERRLCIEQGIRRDPFVLIPYRPNYFIGSWERDVGDTPSPDIEYDSFEAKFQLSFKIAISDYEKPTSCFLVPGTQCITFFGYTQLSVWQMLNLNQSAPFRDTNFEPELYTIQLLDEDIFAGWRLRQITWGLINHQSNGKTPPFSRSWNRSYIGALLENDKLYIDLKLWQRWNESTKSNPSAFKGDDNPGIEDYVGHGELRLLYADDFSNISVTLRDSRRQGNRINYQIDWSVPISALDIHYYRDSDLRFYLQYFNGYGETLIDYDVERHRIGFGVMLNDWF